jgi:hypothetical protein
LTKKSLLSVLRPVVNTPCFEPPWLAPSTRRPPTSTVISGALSESSCARSTSSSASDGRTAAAVVAEAVGLRLEHRERLHVGHFLRRVGAARRERHVERVAGALGRGFDAGVAREHDQVGERDLLAAACVRVEVCWICSSTASTFAVPRAG